MDANKVGNSTHKPKTFFSHYIALFLTLALFIVTFVLIFSADSLKHTPFELLKEYTTTGLLLLYFSLIPLFHFGVTRRVKKIISTINEYENGKRQLTIEVSGKDEIGQLATHLQSMMDSVEKKLTTLYEKEERLCLILQTSVDAIITINQQGIIEWLNPSAGKLFEYTEQELVGKNISILMPDAFKNKHDLYIQNYHSTGAKKVIGKPREEQAVCKSGRIIPIELNVAELNIFGKRIYAGTIHEISERINLREAQRKITHELFSSNLRLKSSNRTDGLTELANRIFFDSELQSEIQRAVRQQHPISLLLIDIDHFKLYNDHYGHHAGDLCLKTVSAALKTTFQRSGELPARYGGEEFAVILPHVEEKQALLLAEKLRTTIVALQLPHIKSPTNSVVTVSVGSATFYPESERSPENSELINAADAALYQAKEQGRNRVVATTANLG